MFYTPWIKITCGYVMSVTPWPKSADAPHAYHISFKAWTQIMIQKTESEFEQGQIKPNLRIKFNMMFRHSLSF